MAACPPLSSPIHGLSVSTIAGGAGSTSFTKTGFLPRSHKLLPSALPPPSARRRRAAWRCRASSGPLDHIPKQFREENLKEGLSENFKNAHEYLYGLSESQMNLFMAEDGLVGRQSQKVTEESISAARSYLDNGGMWSQSGRKERPSGYSMSASMYRGGARGYGRRRSPPRDLPSILLDGRICFLGMPIYPEVTELIVLQLMWLNWDDPSRPIYLYINSSGIQDQNMRVVGSETDAYAIADAMALCRPKIYTLNMGTAHGQAAMLLSLGAKGCRFLQPHASTKLYLPKLHKSSGQSTDMWLTAKELDVSADSYIELLARGIGKPKEEIAKDIQHSRHFQPKDAIAYGIADKIVTLRRGTREKQDSNALLTEKKAIRRAVPGGQAPPSAFS